MVLLTAEAYNAEARRRHQTDSTVQDVHDAFAHHGQLVGNVPLATGARLVAAFLADQ